MRRLALALVAVLALGLVMATSGVAGAGNCRPAWKCPAPPPTPTATSAPSPTLVAASTAAAPRFVWTKSSSTLAEFQHVKALGFTHAMVDPNPSQMALAAQAGLRLVFWGGNYYDPPTCSFRWDDATFTSKVENAKTSPYIGLVDYVFIADEPHGPGSALCPNSPADLTARSNLSHQLLPQAQTIVSENRKEDWPYVGNTADVFLPIIYPCSFSKGCVLSKINDGVTLLHTDGIRNYWATVQTFTEPAGGYYRAPSASELQGIYDRWATLTATDPTRSGLWNYTWGDSCCGDDIGLRDLPDLQPVVQAQNASP